jgi:hypothetical protein
MRLHRHDEIVEDTARRAYEAEPSWFGKPTWDGLEREHQNALELEARRYIDAMLETVVRLEVGEYGARTLDDWDDENVVIPGKKSKGADTLILKLEPKP